MRWVNFIINYKVINKVLIYFFSPLEILLDNKFIKTEYTIVNVKHTTIDLLKNHIYSKNEDFRE